MQGRVPDIADAKSGMTLGDWSHLSQNDSSPAWASLRADVADLLEQLAAHSLVEPRPSSVFRGWSRSSSIDTLSM